MKKQLKISSVNELPEVAKEVLLHYADKRIFAFLGEMGAGKTTLIGSLCQVLEVREHVSSPTFAIVNEYQGRERIFHVDLYRLKTLEEAVDIGIEEYLSGNEYCFIEWPQLIEVLLPPATIHISIEVINEQERILTFEWQ
ncbi:MAG: tRNA (adenosine(37)-N6)-threonylcarbamoyltransferase complex ATPase subunit type 1 TsaE [Chitinophagales bacterium]